MVRLRSTCVEHPRAASALLAYERWRARHQLAGRAGPATSSSVLSVRRRRTKPERSRVATVLDHPEQRQSDQTRKSSIASLHDVHDRIVGIAERSNSEREFWDGHVQPSSLQRAKVGSRAGGFTQSQRLHCFSIDDNRAWIPSVDKELKLANLIVGGNQFKANPCTRGSTFVDVPLFQRCFGHRGYSSMKTSSG